MRVRIKILGRTFYFPKWIKLDKWYHFMAGMMIFGVASVWVNLFFGLVATYFGAFAKELYDVAIKKTKIDVMDIVWTIAIPTLITVIILLT